MDRPDCRHHASRPEVQYLAVLGSDVRQAKTGSHSPDDEDAMRKLGIAALIIAVLVAVVWNPIVDPFLHREQYRGEVRNFYQNVQPGMSKERVRQEMDSGKYPHLDFHRDGQLWLGSAPLEFGAGNWVLAIEFQADQVSAVRVRKGDGLQEYHRPVEAPPDKVHPKSGSD